MKNVLLKIKKSWFFILSFFPINYTANKCRHKTKRKRVVKNKESLSVRTLPLEENGKPDYCLDCIEAMSIQCVLCSQPILIGSRISLYKFRDTKSLPEHAVVHYFKKAKAYVGCLRPNCTNGKFDKIYIWIPGDNGHGQAKELAYKSDAPSKKMKSQNRARQNLSDNLEKEISVAMSE